MGRVHCFVRYKDALCLGRLAAKSDSYEVEAGKIGDNRLCRCLINYYNRSAEPWMTSKTLQGCGPVSFPMTGDELWRPDRCTSL